MCKRTLAHLMTVRPIQTPIDAFGAKIELRSDDAHPTTNYAFASYSYSMPIIHYYRFISARIATS